MKSNRNVCQLISLSTIILLVMCVVQAGAQQSINKDYIIGAGDVLQIQVWDHDDLTRTVEVVQDGSFSFPFIGKVQASGQSVSMLEKQLVEKLSDGYLVGPQVAVGVSEYKNKKKVFLFGEVTRPGSYILKRNMRLLELISDAGGFTSDRGTECTIVRPFESKTDAKPVSIQDASNHEIIRVNLVRLASGVPKENVLLMPNDSIYIATTEHVFVTGEVRRPGEVEYREGMTIRQAISMAGGETPKAALGRAAIIRMDNGKEVEIKTDLGDTVCPNDIVKVPESFF